MNIILKPSYFSHLIHHSLSSNTPLLSKLIHAHLIKLGFNMHTYLGNRLIHLYSNFGLYNDALYSFHDITNKNIISWNIYLQVYIRFSDFNNVCRVFDQIPQRDLVSWNSIISGFSSNGFHERALEFFRNMLDVGIRPDKYTFSAVALSVKSTRLGKEIHQRIIRTMVDKSNLVVGNSLIDMYGSIGLVHYAFGVFFTMEQVDVISWNSLISSCSKTGNLDLGLTQFGFMISHRYLPDEFTLSTVTAVCTILRDLVNGMLIFGLSIKLGFLSNSIVSSAFVDMFSKCNKLESAIQLFEEISVRDNIVCNSMISSYASHGFGDQALRIFLITLRNNLRPDEFTISSVLSAASLLGVAEQGTQIHSLVVKLGIDYDMVVASSLMEMYAKFGVIDSSKEIFIKLKMKDLISWNTMIVGLAQNGRSNEALGYFEELLKSGTPPDHISLFGVLMACCYGGFVSKGLRLFSSLKKAFNVVPRDEHYLSVVEIMIRAGKLREALYFVQKMPYEPSSSIWECIFRGCGDEGDLKLIELVAERLIECKPQLSLPYLVLARAYERRGRWESIVRVRKAMRENNVKTVMGYSWIGIRSQVSVFETNHLFHQEDKETYLMFKLLVWDMGIESLKYNQFENVGAG